jgi:predicted amidohydrolase
MYPLPPEDRFRQDGKARGEDYWCAFVDASVSLEGPELALIRQSAKSARTYVVLGINERSGAREGVIYNTAVLIGADGSLLGTHRKIIAVAHEPLYYTRGAGDDIRTWDTEIGRIGLAICFENLSPLYRHALAAQGEEIHCALWTGTAITPERSSVPIITSATKHAALEARCFAIAASQVSSTTSADERNSSDYRPIAPFIGGSGIAGPAGTYIAGPTFNEEDVVTADIDLGILPKSLALFDPFGRDNRSDVLSLKVSAPG